MGKKSARARPSFVRPRRQRACSPRDPLLRAPPDDADGADTKNHSSAVTSLARADESWLRRLITRRVPLEQWSEAALDTPDQCTVILPQQCLYFLPDPQGHGSFRPTFGEGWR